MKIKNKFGNEAGVNQKSMLTIGIAIGIALMFSVGITIAQQTQGNVVVNAAEKQMNAIDDCPCHHGKNPKTLDNVVICNDILEGIQHIQSLGENWYNQQMINYIISQIENQIYGRLPTDGGRSDDGINQGQLNGGYSYQQVFGENVSGQSQIANYTTAPGGVSPFFLTWEELQERFTIIEQWCQDGGSMPDWEVPGTNGLIWALISPDLISCLLSCVKDAGVATIEFLMAVGLFLSGVPIPIALVIAGVCGVQYGIAITCWNICMLKFGG